MAYTELSEYQYVTGDTVEALSGLIYANIDAVAFSEAKIMAKVTIAEKIVNSYLGKDGAQTKTDGIEMATTIIAAKLIKYNLLELGYASDAEIAHDLIDMSINQILRMFLNVDVGVDAIPMSGANVR